MGGIVLILLTGCVPADAGSDPGNPNQLEAVTSWATDSDRAGLDALEKVFAQQNPGIQFIDASVAGGDGTAARHALDARFDADNPPDTFLATGGAGLRDDVAAGRLRDLDDLISSDGLRGDAFRAGLLDRLAVDGKVYGLPADVHRVNVVWLNIALLRSAGIDATHAPTSIADWLDQLAAMRASGIRYPLALGGDRAPTVLFENVLLSELGDWRYRRLWTDAGGWSSGPVTQAVDDFGRLLDFVDPATSTQTWQQSAQRVVDGDAAFLVSADSAIAVFDAAGLLYGREYSTYATPGTKGVFDFAASTFAVPVAAAHQDAATAWLRTIASASGQVGLALAAGSIPARSDIDPKAFGRYQQTAIASLAKDSIVSSFAYGLAASPTWVADIATAVNRFVTDRKSAALLNRLTAAADDALGSK